MTAWLERAACRGMAPVAVDGRQPRHPFYPGRGRHTEEAIALAICAGCPVRQECLDDALQYERGAWRLFGIRGGLTADQRERLLGKRGRQHGNDAGYQQHLRRGETPCDPCREAHRDHMARWRHRNDGSGVHWVIAS